MPCTRWLSHPCVLVPVLRALLGSSDPADPHHTAPAPLTWKTYFYLRNTSRDLQAAVSFQRQFYQHACALEALEVFLVA